MLETVGLKDNPLALLVGMQIDTATMENSIEIPFKKLGLKLPYDPEIPLLGTYPEKTISEKRHTYAKVHSSIIYNIQGMEAI